MLTLKQIENINPDDCDYGTPEQTLYYLRGYGEALEDTISLLKAGKLTNDEIIDILEGKQHD